MVREQGLTELDALLAEAYSASERLTREALRRRGIAAELSPEAMARLDALPEGEYAEDEAFDALRQVPELVPEVATQDTEVVGDDGGDGLQHIHVHRI